MSDPDSILIATSIAPNTRSALQRDAIDTWRDHGFRVVSLNAPAEIALLRDDFPNVDFVQVERTARLMTGKDHVFIGDILGYLAASGSETVGIVNSDIFIDPNPDLAARLAEYARSGLVCCPRLDIPGRDAVTGTTDLFGYDLFFFRAAVIPLWDRTRLCLGQGYWDHYLPLVAILRGHATYKIVPPIGRHVAHETKRDDSFFLFADEFAALASGYMVDDYPGAIDWTTFGRGFPKRVYGKTRAKVEGGKPEDVEAYAHHIDALTRYVIRFIDENSKHISLA